MMRQGRRAYENFTGLSAGFMQNQPVDVLSRWQKPGDRTNIPKYTQDLPRLVLQGYPKYYDRQYTNASYMRLKNISLSYSFSNIQLKKIHLKNLKFYLLGQNLLTITPYKIIDPETSSTPFITFIPRMPILRTLTAGFQITF
jgi:hypothetical protein